MNSPDWLEPALDQAQLGRIEATHRGFAYQHLYGVACLLDMQATGTDTVVIEHDEDVELLRGNLHIYIQVKTRNRPIQFSDIENSLARFDDLRCAHSDGIRTGTAQFVVTCNIEPGPDLRERLTSDEWPADVALLYPGGVSGTEDLHLPAPWPGLGDALQDCMRLAALVPFTSLAPQTLVLKLAGFVQYLATGHAGHVVSREQVRDFFDQLVIQLQDFPAPPEDYWPQEHEPSLESENKVRLITGVSGSGKTTWAAHEALLQPSLNAYFDIGELPGSALASSLARELAARFILKPGDNGGGAALPLASGRELLGLVSRTINEDERYITVVLDNVHRVSAEVLRELVETASDIHFVMLAQPWHGQAELEARLGVQAETLGGWPLDTVVAVFAAAGCPINASIGQRFLGLTGGLPLYVNNAARLAADAYSGDVNAFLHAIEQRLNVVSTAQEVILAETFGRLTPQARTAAALIELSDIALDNEEVLELIAATSPEEAQRAAAIRELLRAGVVERSQGGAVKLHDVFRLLARSYCQDLWIKIV